MPFAHLHRTLPLAVVVALATQLATPLMAQTSTDDLAATENWWDKVGGKFFSDDGLRTMRPDLEIRAQWTGLSADDQAAIRARCAEMAGTGTGQAASQQQGGNTGLGDANGVQAGSQQAATNQSGAVQTADPAVKVPDAVVQTDGTTTAPQSDTQPAGADQTSTTGAAQGKEVQQPAKGTIGYTGLAGGNPENLDFSPVCKLIAEL